MKNTYKFICFLLVAVCLSCLLGCGGTPNELSAHVLPQEELGEAPYEEPLPSQEERNEALFEESFSKGDETETEIGQEIGSEQATSEHPQKEDPSIAADAQGILFPYPASDYERYAAVCARTGVNVRAGCGTDTAVVGYMGIGRSLPYLGTKGGWHSVWLNGIVGYVSAAYTYLADTCRAVERIVAAGLAKLGTPYVWGAPRIIDGAGNVSPYFTGESFDCSSFVQYCYYVGDGVKLGNYTGSQADYTVGKVVRRYEDLRRGDFYFTGNGSISHVVIYMGGGQLLQAYSANGGPVSFTTDDRWKGKFISGRSVDLSVKKQFC